MRRETDRHLIERLTWDEVARRLENGAAAILPIGAAAKQHGFHLPMNTDRIQAEWLAARLADRIDALIWPTVSYGYYPAFVEYAGSSGLSAPVFEAMIHEIAAGSSALAAARCSCSIPASARWPRSIARWRVSMAARRCIWRFTRDRTIVAPRHSWPSRAMAAMPTNSRRR